MSFISDYTASSAEYWEDESCSALTVDVTNIPASLKESCIIPQVPCRVKKYELRRKCRNVYFGSLMDHHCWRNEEGTTCICSLFCALSVENFNLIIFLVLRLQYNFDWRAFTRIPVHRSVMTFRWVSNLKKKSTPVSVSFSIFYLPILCCSSFTGSS